MSACDRHWQRAMADDPSGLDRNQKVAALLFLKQRMQARSQGVVTSQLLLVCAKHQQQRTVLAASKKKRGHIGGVSGRPWKTRNFARTSVSDKPHEIWMEYWLSDETTAKAFQKKFRVSRAVLTRLEQGLDECLAPGGDGPRDDVVTTRECIMLALAAFGSPCFGIKDLHESTGRGGSTIRKHMDRFAEAVIHVYYLKEVKFPETAEEVLTITTWFRRHRSLPMTMGGMDGKHFTTTAGKRGNWAATKNWKGGNSLNVLAMATAEYLFCWISDFHDGSTTDGRIWGASKQCYKLLDGVSWPPKGTLCDNVVGAWIKPYICVDAAFAGTEYTLRPFPRSNLTYPQQIFNKLQSGARMVIEQAWGMVVNKFRCLLYSLPFAANHKTDWRRKMRNIVLACLILHNICRRAKLDPDDEDDDEGEGDGDDDVDDASSEDDAVGDINCPSSIMLATTTSHNRLRDILSLYAHHYYVLNDENNIRYNTSRDVRGDEAIGPEPG
jgi:hypothetical protein